MDIFLNNKKMPDIIRAAKTIHKANSTAIAPRVFFCRQILNLFSPDNITEKLKQVITENEERILISPPYNYYLLVRFKL